MTTYHKTKKGRDAVAAGPGAGLALPDRRILILADGRRTLAQLRAMLGSDILVRVQRLERDGYLTATPERAGAATPAPAPAPAAGNRRSLAASKMYLLDMLQLQRSTEAAELSAAIRVAASDEELLDALLAGLRHILASSKESYGERVAQRLASTLPEAALPRVEALLPPKAGVRPRLSIVA